MGNWRSTANIGGIYAISQDDFSRVGSDWIKGRLKQGDLVLAIQHSGDCFYNYFLINLRDYGDHFTISKLINQSFGSYHLGEHIYSLNKIQIGKFENGESIRVHRKPFKKYHPNYQEHKYHASKKAVFVIYAPTIVPRNLVKELIQICDSPDELITIEQFFTKVSSIDAAQVKGLGQKRIDTLHQFAKQIGIKWK